MTFIINRALHCFCDLVYWFSKFSIHWRLLPVLPKYNALFFFLKIFPMENQVRIDKLSIDISILYQVWCPNNTDECATCGCMSVYGKYFLAVRGGCSEGKFPNGAVNAAQLLTCALSTMHESVIMNLGLRPQSIFNIIWSVYTQPNAFTII